MALPIATHSASTGLRVLESDSGCRDCSCGTNSALDQRVQALREELSGRVRIATEGCSKRRHSGPEEVPMLKKVELKQDRPLPLAHPLSRHEIDGKYMWVAVERAGLVVLNERDDRFLRLLSEGQSPATVAAQSDEGWPPLLKLLGRLGSNGLIQGMRGHIEQRPNSPRVQARFHLTQACQLECIHCYANSSPFIDRTGELTLERWQRLVDDFARHGGQRLLFSGGEALMYRGCTDLMRQASEAGLTLTLLTNGILVPRYLEEIHETVSEVQVSLDGPTAEANDRIRGKGTYPRILKAIDLLVARGTMTRIGMSVMAANWEDWKEGFLEFTSRYQGVENIEFYLSGGITSWGRGASIEDVDGEETGPLVRDLLDRANPDRGPKITRFAAGCGYFEQLVVDPWGKVHPCHLLDGAAAHIDDFPYEELIRILEESRDLFSVDHIEGCKDCDIRYLCGGSCRVMNGKDEGTRLVTNCTPADYQRRLNNLVNGWYGENAMPEVV